MEISFIFLSTGGRRGCVQGIQFTRSFFLALELQIYILNSQLLGVCGAAHVVEQAALIGCSILSNKFAILALWWENTSSRIKAWDDVILRRRSASLSGRVAVIGFLSIQLSSRSSYVGGSGSSYLGGLSGNLGNRIIFEEFSSKRQRFLML
ncbi:hypothetical protein Tco_1571595 [Tanacetum coccineum]